MSGFDAGPGKYGLTATKARYWHRFCDCDAKSIVDEHLVPAGFKVEKDGGNYVILSGPGLAERSTDELYTAARGRLQGPLKPHQTRSSPDTP